MLPLKCLGGDPVWGAQMRWASGALMIGEQEQFILVDLPKSAKKADRRTHPRQAVSTPAELSVAEGTEDENAAKQRVHPRVDVAFQVNIEAPLQLGGQEVMRLELSGTAIDISRGGVLVRVDQDVTLGARCEVYFPEAKEKIEPNMISGKVARSEAHGEVFHLAIKFDAPLEGLPTANGAS